MNILEIWSDEQRARHGVVEELEVQGRSNLLLSVPNSSLNSREEAVNQTNAVEP